MARPCLDTWIFQQIWGDSTVSFSPFPQLLHTERPDRVIGNLLEGRVALLAEGSPTALILPVTFSALASPFDPKVKVEIVNHGIMN
ncbi:spore germination protein KA [Paenibacillus dendritiformis C454]|uniref:Spore germination protein KA n=1 Tax=Paenibacillus dendritiformis C454 TaxID=1131935 RepID=H3SDJ4_9BACL|nr:spore germination protein KA [Paenibacillus dendritiformis C454]